jgi:hypothetical protein
VAVAEVVVETQVMVLVRAGSVAQTQEMEEIMHYPPQSLAQICSVEVEVVVVLVPLVMVQTVEMVL